MASNMSILKRCLIAAGFLVGAQAASAAVVLHGSGVFDTGSPSNFSQATYTFATEYADTITISDFGGGFAHDHGFPGGTAVELEVLSGGNWLTVFTHTLAPGQQLALSSIFASPITFTGSLISGIRLDSVPFNNQTFHSVSSSMTYRTSGTPVPEPASLVLVAAALLAAGAASGRRAGPTRPR